MGVGLNEPWSRRKPVVVPVSGAYGPENGRGQYVGYWLPSARTKPIPPQKKIKEMIPVDLQTLSYHPQFPVAHLRNSR